MGGESHHARNFEIPTNKEDPGTPGTAPPGGHGAKIKSTMGKVRKYDITTLKPYRIILIVGKRGTGKSVMSRHCMYHMREDIDICIGMSPTEETVQFFVDHTPASLVHRSFSEQAVKELVTHQRRMAHKKRKQEHVLLILDDMMYDKSVLKSPVMRDIFMNGRHLKITVIIAMQYCMDMSPDLRSQVDYVMVMRDNIMSNRMKLYKFFFGVFPTFGEFASTMDACTENHECLLIDNTQKSNQITDIIFWYRADTNLPPFRLSSKKYWLLHALHERPEEDTDEDSEEDYACGGDLRG